MPLERALFPDMRSDSVTSPADAGFGRDIINEILVGLDSRVQEKTCAKRACIHVCAVHFYDGIKNTQCTVKTW